MRPVTWILATNGLSAKAAAVPYASLELFLCRAALTCVGDRSETDRRDDLLVVAILPRHVEQGVPVEEVLEIERRDLQLHA